MPNYKDFDLDIQKDKKIDKHNVINQYWTQGAQCISVNCPWTSSKLLPCAYYD